MKVLSGIIKTKLNGGIKMIVSIIIQNKKDDNGNTLYSLSIFENEHQLLNFDKLNISYASTKNYKMLVYKSDFKYFKERIKLYYTDDIIQFLDLGL